MDNNKEKKFTFSKLLIIITGSMFFLVCLFTAFIYISGRIDSAFDTTAIVTMITVTGTMFTSNICWYSKKSASENHYKLRMALYNESAKVRLEFNEKMIKLMQENGLCQADIDEIEAQGDCDEFMNDALTSAVTELDTLRDTSESENEVEQV